MGEPANARQGPATAGEGDRDNDLAGARRIGNAHFHPVEMAADIGRRLVAERHVEDDAERAALLRGRDQRRRLAQELAQGLTELGMQDRGRMLQLTFRAVARGIAISLDRIARDAERR